MEHAAIRFVPDEITFMEEPTINLVISDPARRQNGLRDGARFDG
ncbi:hypothetical protein ACFOOP_15195 [Marinicaulis aureus]|uniref:Uncharacterized protein n=1 Tax=Hyphococcus aureus TaxID=2666033 RepID=A0ABW1L1F9_9PROT